MSSPRQVTPQVEHNPVSPLIDPDAQAILARRALFAAVAVAGLSGVTSCGGIVGGDGATATAGGSNAEVPGSGSGGLADGSGGSTLRPSTPLGGNLNTVGGASSGETEESLTDPLASGGALAMGGFVNIGGAVASGGADTVIDPGSIEFDSGTGGVTSSECACQGAMCQGCT